jgi:hypothetical protein
LTAPQADAVRALDGQLDRMSGEANAHHWTNNALVSDPAWVEVRRLARECLAVMNWGDAVPPRDRGAVYVSGRGGGGRQ